MNASQAMNTYRKVGVQSAIDDASPHQLIAMLLDGALGRIASARGAMERGDKSNQGVLISKTMAILDNLRVSLDHDKGGELAERLASLYEYMERRLLEASSTADVAILDEVSGILREIKTGWDGIPAEYR